MKGVVTQIIFNLFFWVLIAVPTLGILIIYYLNITVTFMFIIYIITILLGIVFVIFSKKVKIPPFLALLVPYFFYKFFIDYYFDESCKGSYYLTARNDFFIIAIFFALIIIFNSTMTERQASILKKYIIFLIIVSPIVTIIQVFNPLFLQIDYFSGTGNIISVYSQRRPSLFGFEDANALGFTYLPLAFTFISMRIFENRKKALIFFLVCIMIVVVFSNSRYIILGLILIFLQLILSNRNKVKAVLYLLSLLILSLFLFYFVYNSVGLNITDLYNDRLHDEGSTFARLASYNAFIRVFPQYMFWGIGNQLASPILLELKGASPFIHIGFLNHLIVYGLIGSSFLFGFWFALFKRLFKRARKTKYFAGLFAFLFFLWANVSLVMYSIFFSGLLLSLIAEKYYTTQILKNNNKMMAPITSFKVVIRRKQFHSICKTTRLN